MAQSHRVWSQPCQARPLPVGGLHFPVRGMGSNELCAQLLGGPVGWPSLSRRLVVPLARTGP